MILSEATAMTKKIYSNPQTRTMSVHHSGVLCASNNSNIYNPNMVVNGEGDPSIGR